MLRSVLISTGLHIAVLGVAGLALWAPEGFDDVNDVLSHEDREAIVRGYAQLAGFAARRRR